MYQGTLPFMAVELLINSNNDMVEHSAKHDLESFFYVLLYICMMCEGPGKLRSDIDLSDPHHPFGKWIWQAKTWHAIGVYRLAAFSDSDVMQKKVLTHVHPYFIPLLPTLTNFCDAIFGTYAQEGQSVQVRNPQKPCGTHKSVLDVLRSAFNTLGDIDEDVSGIPEGVPQMDGAPTHATHATPAIISSPSPAHRTATSNMMAEVHANDKGLGNLSTFGSDSGYGEEGASTSTSRSSGGSRSPSKRSSHQRMTQGTDVPSSKRTRHDF